MGELVFGLVLLAVAFFLRLGAATVRSESAASKPVSGVLRILSYVALMIGVITVLGSTAVVFNAGEVGVRHAFGTVDPAPLLAGVRFVAPWSSVERFSTREEQWPQAGAQVEEIEALSSEQMGMHVEVSIRWHIDPQQARRGAERDPQGRPRRHGAVFDQRHRQAHANREHDGSAHRLRARRCR